MSRAVLLPAIVFRSVDGEGTCGGGSLAGIVAL